MAKNKTAFRYSEDSASWRLARNYPATRRHNAMEISLPSQFDRMLSSYETTLAIDLFVSDVAKLIEQSDK
jgi:hypothetical protein